MASEIVVPRLGWNMEQGVFLGWLKQPGEMVKAGEALFTLEGDKSSQEIESMESGILHVLPDGPTEGQIVAVGTVIGHLAPVGAPAAVAVAVPAAVAQAPSRQAVTPRARRVARERGIELARVRGTGRGGRVRERDVLALEAPAPREAPREMPKRQEGRSHPRRVIAERMAHSHRTTAPVTLTTTMDATNLVNLREQFRQGARDANAAIPSFTDLIVKLTALALRGHPHLTARFTDEGLVFAQAMDIGLAVDTEAGLLVPVIRDVPSLSLRQLAAQTRSLSEKARQKQLTAEEMENGCFTVTSLGALGIDAFTPIINWPESAILGVGRIQRRAAVVQDELVARDEVTFSLTFDHRVLDGAPAARFLQTLRKGIENPSAWLIE